MKFARIIEEITKNYAISVLYTSDTAEIYDIALLDTSLTHYNKTTLYFGYENQWHQLHVHPCQCILASATAFFETAQASVTSEKESNLVLTSSDDLFAIFNFVKTLIDVNRSQGLYRELIAIADTTRSLDTVLDTAAVRLGNALIFCDTAFKIISSSFSIPISDPIWENNIRQGYCNYDFITAVKKLEPLKNASQIAAAIEVSCPESPYRKLSCRVFQDNVQIGFVLMIEGETTFMPSHREMLTTVSLALSYTIAHHIPDLFRGPSPYQLILYDMLIGTPAKEILPRLNGMVFPDCMFAAYIHPTQYLGHRHLEEHITAMLKLQFPQTHITYHKNGIAAVIPLKNTVEISNELRSHLMDFANQEHVCIGISNAFSNIEYFVDYFEQAYTARELGMKYDPHKAVYCYRDYQLFALFSETKEPDKLERFCHPALALLRQYDHKNNTQLYHTLCVYLETGGSIKQTSERLYIHRNSMVYRLNRIMEVCQINPDDNDTRLLLRISYLIDKYNGMNEYKTN